MKKIKAEDYTPIVRVDEKNNNRLVLFRNNEVCICPYRAPVLVPIPENQFSIPGQGQGLALSGSECNSRCPHWRVEEVDNDEVICSLNCAEMSSYESISVVQHIPSPILTGDKPN